MTLLWPTAVPSETRRQHSAAKPQIKVVAWCCRVCVFTWPRSKVCEELTGRALVGLNSLVCVCACPCRPGPCGECLSCENFTQCSPGESSHLPRGPAGSMCTRGRSGMSSLPPLHLPTPVPAWLSMAVHVPWVLSAAGSRPAARPRWRDHCVP